MKKDSKVPSKNVPRDFPYYPTNSIEGEGGDATFSIRLAETHNNKDNYIASWYTDGQPTTFQYGGFLNTVKTATTNRAPGIIKYALASDSTISRIQNDAPAFRIYANKDALPKGKWKPVQSYTYPMGGPVTFTSNFQENAPGMGGPKGRTLAGEKLRTEPQFTLKNPIDGASIKIA